MKKVKVTLVLVLCMAMLSCSSLTQIKANWTTMKSDEKARVVCEFLQTELGTLFDSGKAYVTAHPDTQAVWKAKVVPAFDIANKALAGYMVQAKADKVTFIDVVSGMLPLLNPITSALSGWGIDVSSITKLVGGL